MNGCSQHQQELAVCASTGQEPSAKLALHLGRCANCRDTFAEFKRVTALQTGVAARLPEPRLAFNFRQRLMHAPEPARYRLPVLAFATTAAVTLLLSILFLPREPERANVPQSSSPLHVNTVVTAEFSDSTWQAFRQQLGAEDLALNTPHQIGSSDIYRLKDAYSERN